MRNPARRALGIVVAGLAVISLAAPTMAAAPVTDRGSGGQVSRIDNHPGPLTERQNARRKAAQELILSGKASPNADGVVQLAEDKFFQATVTGEGQVFTILSEFGDQGTKKLGLVPGPLHNEIAKPNRETVDGQPNPDYDASLPYDNFRQWKANFNEAYYHDLFFGAGDSFADFYEKQSSGAYTVAGDVGNQSNGHDGWVKVPGNASTYGDNAVEDFGGAWQFIEDSGNAWYADALAALGSKADVEAYLSQFDVWDRNDFNNNGNLRRAGRLHRPLPGSPCRGGRGRRRRRTGRRRDLVAPLVRQPDRLRPDRPEPTRRCSAAPRSATPSYWIGDYTVEAENGGLGVFAHEFAHDLGLPDFYDTNAGENGTAFWTLMSSGSWMNEGTEDIGTKPDYMGPWEKLQLGWLDYSVVAEGADRRSAPSTRPRPSSSTSRTRPSRTTYTTAYSGTHAWWTSSADDLNTTLDEQRRPWRV